MNQFVLVGLAAASVSLSSPTAARAGFADAVIGYEPGVGATPFDDPAASLGAPTSLLDYGPVDPFNAPYSTNDVVTVGDGGSLTVQLSRPIRDQPGHSFGVDFLVFGNAGFIITNQYDPETWLPIGEPATDGSLYGAASAGVSRVSVSVDGVDFYVLNPLLAPTLDQLFPGDSTGSPFLAVNPSLTGLDFAGRDLAGIRSLYAGSAGGAGFDLGWAVDEFDQPVSVTEARFVRVEALGGEVEIDAFVVVPEPSSATMLCLALLALRITSARHH